MQHRESKGQRATFGILEDGPLPPLNLPMAK